MKSREFQELLDKLSTYQYGILYNDGKFVSDKDEMDKRDGTDIIVQTPSMMDEHKSGMCHDASIYVDEELSRLDINHRCVYIASHVEPMLPTHSFVLAFDDETMKWMIVDVFASNDCVYTDERFDDLNDAISMRVAAWIRDDNNSSADLDVFIADHMPAGGCGFLEYTEKIIDSFSEYSFTRGYSHIEYEGTGIYQALKRALSMKEWRSILESEDISWLPKPPEYNGRCKSYFTMKGYKEFKEKVLPICKRFLDISKIKETYVETLDDSAIIYSDEFQVVVQNRKFDSMYEDIMRDLSINK